ncbi:MAG: SLC13 family permease [Alphaproteobacteria bacterium]
MTEASEPAAGTSAAVKRFGFIAGLVALGVTWVLPAPEGMPQTAWATAGVALLMAFWWATEALPVAATSLIPIIFFPLLGVTDIRGATHPYASPLIYLFMGGFVIALAMERWNLHRRIALAIISGIGAEPHRLVLGFMLATALLSMWISNTATTMMMLPIGASVAGIILAEGADTARRNFATALMLGIAYAASVGGVGTLIGTPTNLAMANILAGPEFGIEIDFARWLLVGLPFVAIMLPLVWLVLTRFVYTFDLGASDAATAQVAHDRKEMGRITVPEQRVAILAGIVALLWVSRRVLTEYIPGLSDAGIAMAGALLLFILPAGGGNRGAVMNWETAVKLPWGLILLFGGGLSLAEAMGASGLAGWISTNLEGLGTLPFVALIAIIVVVIVFLTELTSNAATVSAFVPVIAALAVGIGLDPVILAAPVAIAASCAFMLPVATPPNAVVFGSGYITIPQMVRAGIWLNMLSVVIVTTVSAILIPLVFG